MKQDDFPALYISADLASNSTQAMYLWLLRLQYSLLFSAAVAALWFGAEKTAYLIYAVLVVASTCLLIFMWVRKPERDWYGCRALAELIKTATWRYTMRAEPFEDAPELRVVQRKFSDFLEEILDANKHVRDPISRRPTEGDQITESMNALRALALEDRKIRYLQDRIVDQQNWYVRKTKLNRSQYRNWIFVCIFIQGSAILLALARIANDGWNIIWPTEPLLVLAAAIVGWI